MGCFRGFRPPITKRQNKESDLFLRDTSQRDVKFQNPLQLAKRYRHFKAKVIDVGETQLISQKELKMAETIISDGETTSTQILWEKDVAAVQKDKAFNFQQVRVRVRDEKKMFNTTKKHSHHSKQ